MIRHFTQRFGGNIEVVLVEEAILTVKILKGWRYPKNGTKAADWTDCALIVEHFIQLSFNLPQTTLGKGLSMASKNGTANLRSQLTFMSCNDVVIIESIPMLNLHCVEIANHKRNLKIITCLFYSLGKKGLWHLREKVGVECRPVHIY